MEAINTKKTFTLCFDEGILNRLDERAKNNRRSRNGEAELAILQYLSEPEQETAESN